jgi:hypothetical protein
VNGTYAPTGEMNGSCRSAPKPGEKRMRAQNPSQYTGDESTNAVATDSAREGNDRGAQAIRVPAARPPSTPATRPPKTSCTSGHMPSRTTWRASRVRTKVSLWKFSSPRSHWTNVAFR